jgi:hypothetical protein
MLREQMYDTKCTVHVRLEALQKPEPYSQHVAEDQCAIR